MKDKAGEYTRRHARRGRLRWGVPVAVFCAVWMTVSRHEYALTSLLSVDFIIWLSSFLLAAYIMGGIFGRHMAGAPPDDQSTVRDSDDDGE